MSRELRGPFLFLLFVELHQKVLILRDFSLPLESFNGEGALDCGVFPPLRSVIAGLSFESTQGKVSFPAVMLVRSA